MANSKNSDEVKQEIKTIKEAKKRVLEQIKKVEEQLSQVGNLKAVPWITFKRVYSVKDLAGHHRTLKEALEDDLRKLKENLRKLNLNQHRANLAYSKLEAQKKSKQLRRKISATLKNGEKTGTLSDKSMEDLLAESEKILKAHLDILEAEPNEENIKNVLKEMEVQYSFGADNECAICKQSWNVLKKQSKKISEKASWHFRRNPTQDNIKKMFKAFSNYCQFGGNLQEFSPKGWQAVNTTYKVKKGDTLSGISKKFYKKLSYWDIIYIENYSKIGEDPKKLIINTELVIP